MFLPWDDFAFTPAACSQGVHVSAKVEQRPPFWPLSMRSARRGVGDYAGGKEQTTPLSPLHSANARISNTSLFTLGINPNSTNTDILEHKECQPLSVASCFAGVWHVQFYTRPIACVLYVNYCLLYI